MSQKQIRYINAQSGRSMVEMLGTLAIMGVLTIGGVAGYRYAINKSNANTILNTVSMMAIVASTELTTHGSLTLPEWKDTNGNLSISGAFGVTTAQNNDGTFSIIVSDMNDGVCEQIKGMDWKLPYEIAYNGSVDGTCSAGENNEIAFAFAKTLNKNDVEASGGSGDDTTPPEEDIVCDAGYYLDGTECQLCAAGTYAAAGANSCTTCPANTYSSAGAASCTDCPSGTTAPAGSTSAAACKVDLCSNKNCSNHGTCSDGECTCDSDYIGDNCEVKGACFINSGSQSYSVDDFNGTVIAREYCEKKGRECGNLCPPTAGECNSRSDLLCMGSVDAADHPLQEGAYGYDSQERKCACIYLCFTDDTLITLANGTMKRADAVTYDDELLVWNFDEGHFDTAKPLWIKQPTLADKYILLKFSDGSILKFVNNHRIFNREAGRFTYPMTDDTPTGTTTLNARGEWVTLVEQRVVTEQVTYYNIITDRHLNCFAGNILTSCRLNNIYPIRDLKFVKDNRVLTPYTAFAELPKKWYDGLRLAEQPKEINRGNDVHHTDTLTEYVQRLIVSAKEPEQSVLAA